AIRASVDSAKSPSRVVVKSSPAPRLIEHVSNGMGSRRMMVFSAEMSSQLSPLYADADMSMGKPSPAAEFARVIDKAGPQAAARPQWSIDTPQRLSEYAAIAKAHGVPLQASFELDVGSHRGGFPDATALAPALAFARDNSVRIAGSMGYDPHVPKMPLPERAYAASQAAYRAAIDAVR
ncbi:hypothetical protein OY671_010350, partial [Metschnikowia pulcherrima]